MSSSHCVPVACDYLHVAVTVTCCWSLPASQHVKCAALIALCLWSITLHFTGQHICSHAAVSAVDAHAFQHMFATVACILKLFQRGCCCCCIYRELPADVTAQLMASATHQLSQDDLARQQSLAPNGTSDLTSWPPHLLQPKC